MGSLLPAAAGSSSMTQPAPDALSSVDKALCLLEAFSWDTIEMGVSEIARRADLPKSTAFRLLSILVERGFVDRTGTNYSLGPKLTDLAHCVPQSSRSDLRDAALPYLQDLYELTHETVHLAVLDGIDAVYVEKIFGHDPAPTPSRVGGRMPATCTAVGKAMIAYSDASTVQQVLNEPHALTPHSIVVPSVLLEEMRRTRSDGVAFDREEARPGLTCVAAPILSPQGALVGAVSVSGRRGRFRPQDFGSAVRRAATGIARNYAGTRRHA